MQPRGLVSVRLTEEETRQLDLLAITWGLPTRSDVLRVLIQRAEKLSPPGEEPIELPPMLVNSLEHLMENGWARTLSEAVTKAADRGLTVLVEEYGARENRMDEIAAALHKRSSDRKSMAPSGDRLLKGRQE